MDIIAFRYFFLLFPLWIFHPYYFTFSKSYLAKNEIQKCEVFGDCEGKHSFLWTNKWYENLSNVTSLTTSWTYILENGIVEKDKWDKQMQCGTIIWLQHYFSLNFFKTSKFNTIDFRKYIHFQNANSHVKH